MGPFLLSTGETHETHPKTLQLGQSQGQTRARYQQVVPAMAASTSVPTKCQKLASLEWVPVMNGLWGRRPSLEWPQSNAARAPGRHPRLVPAHPALMNGFGEVRTYAPAQ
jgi:hypothetical protein